MANIGGRATNKPIDLRSPKRFAGTAITLSLLIGTSCIRPARAANDTNDPRAAVSATSQRSVSKMGAQCIPYGKLRPEGPRSYLVSDIGKPGVPHLDARAMRAIHKIQRYVHSSTLRFVAEPFMLFDATRGPCLDIAGEYPLLNGACNEFYEPGEDPYHAKAAPGDICPKYPWMRDARKGILK